MKKGYRKMVLLKDLVIKKGAIFGTAPHTVKRDPSEFVECVIGLSKDTAGHLTYEVGQPGSYAAKQTRKWFKDVEE